MTFAEPHLTAVALAVLGGLLVISILLSRVTDRLGVPGALLFLVLGMLVGSEGFGGIEFDDHGLAFRIGSAALVLILFDGGLNTPLAAVRPIAVPASILASVGVAGTAALAALGARLLGFAWAEALLFGAVVSSTDAAAVFAVLRGGGVHLRQRVGATLEFESGANDPMAVILTMAVTQSVISGEALGWSTLAGAGIQLAVGVLAGVLAGHVARQVLRRVQVTAGGLYPILSIGVAFFTFGLATLAGGSGFLAVYIAGIVLGNGPLPYRAGILRVHDSVAWFSQISMFLLLGLLIYPSELTGVVWHGLALALFLAFVARPVVVLVLLLPFKFTWRERLFVSWVGLRGAVPIILAAFPLLAGAEGALLVFNLVFFVVVVGALIPGTTVRWAARRMGLEEAMPPPPRAMLEVNSMGLLRGELLSFHVDPATMACGAAISDLAFPEDATVMLVVRGNDLIPPRGGTRLEAGDHVYIFCRDAAQRGVIQLIFGPAVEH